MIPIPNHTNEAIAFVVLYRSMHTNVQKEIKAMILQEPPETDELTDLTFQAWDAEGDRIRESEVWEKFYNNKK